MFYLSSMLMFRRSAQVLGKSLQFTFFPYATVSSFSSFVLGVDTYFYLIPEVPNVLSSADPSFKVRLDSHCSSSSIVCYYVVFLIEISRHGLRVLRDAPMKYSGLSPTFPIKDDFLIPKSMSRNMLLTHNGGLGSTIPFMVLTDTNQNRVVGRYS